MPKAFQYLKGLLPPGAFANGASMRPHIANFWDLASNRPNAVALIDENQCKWTAAQLLQECNRIANGLRDLGLEKGSVIALLMPTCGQLLATVLATQQIGMYALLINPRFSQSEVQYMLEDSGAGLLILHEGVAGATTLSAELAESRLIRVSIGEVQGCLSYDKIFGRAPVSTPPCRCGGRILMYTSGTTGRPKAVLRAVREGPPEAVLAEIIAWYAAVYEVRAGDPDVQLSCCPLYFGGPLYNALFALHLGHTVVMLKYWNPRVALHLIQRYAITTAFMVPYHFHTLLRLPNVVRQHYNVQTIKRIIHTGAPCPEHTKREILEWFGDHVYENYGATEIGGTVASAEEWRRYPGTVGRAAPPHEVRILDDHGNTLPPRIIGRVFLREIDFSRFVYKGDPEKTAACRVGDFVTAGDIGYLNEEGYLFLCDRREDLIICRGENVYPAQVEGALASHLSVADCACYGLPHSEWGQQVALAVKWEDSTSAEARTRESVLSHLRARLPLSRLPSVVHFVEVIPRDASGKLRRADLRRSGQ